MHLLVLSAFRHAGERVKDLWVSMSQCTFWCSVLSDIGRFFLERGHAGVSMHLLVLSAFRRDKGIVIAGTDYDVSMHLLVLSAFRPIDRDLARRRYLSQCTFWCSVLSDEAPGLEQVPRRVSMHLLVLSAFRQKVTEPPAPLLRVSMHLLVLSAFRLQPVHRRRRPNGVSMHLLVLSAFRLEVTV